MDEKVDTPTRDTDIPNCDNTAEPTLNKILRDLIQRIKGTVLSVHGDGAC